MQQTKRLAIRAGVAATFKFAIDQAINFLKKRWLATLSLTKYSFYFIQLWFYELLSEDNYDNYP